MAMKLEYQLTPADYLELLQIQLKSEHYLNFIFWGISILCLIQALISISSHPEKLSGYLFLGFGIGTITAILTDKAHQFVFWVPSISLILLGIQSIVTQPQQIGAYLSILAGMGLIGLIAPVQRYIAEFIWRSQPSHNETTNIEVSEEGITFQNAQSESNLRWRIFTHFFESENLFALYLSNQTIQLIPKRAFDPRSLQEFRELIGKRLMKRPY